MSLLHVSTSTRSSSGFIYTKAYGYRNTGFAILSCLFIYLPDDELVEVETCMRGISEK
jgi:hypothetical protein